MTKQAEPLVSWEEISTLEQCQLNRSPTPPLSDPWLNMLVPYGTHTHKVSKGAKIRNRYNQVPHLTQDTNGNIQKLEMVQRRAARYVMNRQRNTSSVSDMLQRLNWRSLECRRKETRLCMMFKIDRRLYAISKEPRLQPARRKTTRLQHHRAFQIITCRTDKRKMSFFPRTVKGSSYYGLRNTWSLKGFSVIHGVLDEQPFL